jgi:hypothetical protein
MVQQLEKLSVLVDNPETGGKGEPLLNEYYEEVTPLGHLI